jgi:hypothetical protein
LIEHTEFDANHGRSNSNEAHNYGSERQKGSTVREEGKEEEHGSNLDGLMDLKLKRSHDLRCRKGVREGVFILSGVARWV